MKTKLNCYYILNTILLISGIAFDFILFLHPFFISVAMKIIIATVLCVVVILDVFVCKQLLSEGSPKMPKTETSFVSVLTFVLLISQSIYLTIITLMGANEILGTIKTIPRRQPVRAEHHARGHLREHHQALTKSASLRRRVFFE